MGAFLFCGNIQIVLAQDVENATPVPTATDEGASATAKEGEIVEGISFDELQSVTDAPLKLAHDWAAHSPPPIN